MFLVQLLEGNCFSCSYGQTTGSPYGLKPLPSGVPRSICFCGDPSKVEIPKDEKTYKQRYWNVFQFYMGAYTATALQ